LARSNHSELDEFESDLVGFIHDGRDGKLGSWSDESGRGTSMDVAIPVIEEDIGEHEDTKDVLGDGYRVLRDQLVQLGDSQL